MSLLLVTTMFLAGANGSADTVVVCPDSFRDALQPWIVHRENQGHVITHVSNEQGPEEIRDDIREIARSGAVQAIVLVGDASPTLSTRINSATTPTFLVDAKVNVLWGSEPTIATDNSYADVDDDGLPDITIGRLSADSPEQLTHIVRKIIAYETEAAPGLWRRRVNFVAGVGGFGAVADNVIESATKKVLTDGIPASYETSMTYGSWRSPFCPDPRYFHQAAVDRLNEGSLFWVYIGHGQRRFLDQVTTPGGRYHIFDTDDVKKIRRVSGSPIAVFLSCYTGAFDEVRDCMGEEMLRAEQGPVAALCGSRVTMPYAMSVMGRELMKQFFVKRRATLGELVLHAKREMARDLSPQELAGDTTRHLLDSIAKVISPAPDSLDAERREHVLMFNLLGDPLLRLDQPNEVVIAVEPETETGNRLRIACRSELSGRCNVELICRRDRLKDRFVARPRYDGSDEALANYTNVYAQANNRTWSASTFDCKAGEFEAVLDVPDGAAGTAFVRVFIDGDSEYGLGAANVYVRRAKPRGQ